MHGLRSAAAIALLSTIVCAQGDAYMEKKDMRAPGKEFSPYANRGFPTRVFFGDTHLHTSLSVDAGSFGNRFCRRIGWTVFDISVNIW